MTDAPHEDHAHGTAETVAKAAEHGPKPRWYQFATHHVKDGEVAFSGKRTLIFAGGALVAAGGAYLLTRGKGEDRTQYEGNAQQALA